MRIRRPFSILTGLSWVAVGLTAVTTAFTHMFDRDANDPMVRKAFDEVVELLQSSAR